MRRLNPGTNGERGAVAVLVAILMVALIGFAAIGVDIANMASDKQQLQNGADAAAFSIGEDCAKGECSGTYDEFGKATALATSNKNDGQVTVTDVDIASHQVTVVVEDETEHWFARIWNLDSSTVRARATVSWMWSILSMGGLPLAMDEGYMQCVAGGAPEIFTGVVPEDPTFVQGDNGFWEYTGVDSPMVRLYLSSSAGGSATDAGCDLDGQWTPGGFGWIDTYGTCESETSVGDPASVKPGEPPPNDCKTGEIEALIGTPIPLPVFQGEAADGSGTGGMYTITGYVAFVIDGIHVPDVKNQVGETGFSSGKQMCVKPDAENQATEFCIVGHFTTAASLDGVGTPGGDDSGAHVIKLEE